ncbi:4363_t:CDS:2 [Paraglomus occultum]|uniref:4363_t:CDS:1 n=1 Tax=Paraglomus occultum TaxID=144539 RepID=A0A9N9F0U3_9GLOM|nr:4363_t:CDS:2 [Paraglomus occultum]
MSLTVTLGNSEESLLEVTTNQATTNDAENDHPDINGQGNDGSEELLREGSESSHNPDSDSNGKVQEKRLSNDTGFSQHTSETQSLSFFVAPYYFATDYLSDESNSEDDNITQALKRERKTIFQRLMVIETQFSIIKERVYAAKEALLEKEHQEIQSGTHARFADEYKRIEEVRRRRLRIAEERRKRRSLLAQANFEAQHKQVLDEFMAARRSLRMSMIEERQAKIIRLHKEYAERYQGIDHKDRDLLLRVMEEENPQRIRPIHKKNLPRTLSKRAADRNNVFPRSITSINSISPWLSPNGQTKTITFDILVCV